MDFFGQQDRARTKTTALVLYFVLAIVFIIGSVYAASLLILHFTQVQTDPGTPVALASWGSIAPWDLQLFGWVVAGTLGVVTVGAAYKFLRLSRGGSEVAEELGGRLLAAEPTDADERRLRNVVEEMALAANVPVPKVYVLDNDAGINAFAAGHSAKDAAIGITRGGMTLLTRDELQGVIGHEFSHLLNGDMRLNIRIMGVLFGIVCLTVIGRVLLYSRGGGNRGRAPMMLLGVALLAIGALGVLFGRLIQAALSRQREMLADASAVQFTRNPAGLAGALRKIGSVGARIDSPHAGEASHMFFENGLGKPVFGWLATHPPLAERIRAIDPSWDGRFDAIDPPHAVDAADAPA
ncbi:M48 family metallopeptidase [Hydrogenophaga sp.]|uniref:M48 family metallopeptidase n=1 Tax=Hydrogenophaga sp. TaxID=1904254 RepID=UPI0027283035|nr:M48 family metallopeptidase [Hydrogenophaga sp.]MDO8906767.1 M48 family metallopeptidase [Hydrogenophaga sp.]